jgi:hypothetical protein
VKQKKSHVEILSNPSIVFHKIKNCSCHGIIFLIRLPATFIKNAVIYSFLTMGRLFRLEEEHGLGRRRESGGHINVPPLE